MVLLANKISESLFRRFSFFPNIRNILRTKNLRPKIFFLSEIFTKILIFFQKFFCSAEDFLFVINIFVRTKIFFFGKKLKMAQNVYELDWPNLGINS